MLKIVLLQIFLRIDFYFRYMKNINSSNPSTNPDLSSNTNLVKIHKVIARNGYCSNRKAEELIKQNRVRVNSQTAHLGQLIDKSAIIEIDGVTLKYEDENKIRYTFIMNKKVGDECSRNPFKNINKSIFSRFNSKEEYFQALKCVGRLDVKTSGLIIITTNSELIQQIIHPSSNISKTYVVALNRTLKTEDKKTLLEEGVVIENSISKPISIKALKYSSLNNRIVEQISTNTSIKNSFSKHYWYEVVVKEGKKHIIRKFFEYFKYRVEILHRSKIGNLNLNNFDLDQKEFEKIDENELMKFIMSRSNNTNS